MCVTLVEESEEGTSTFGLHVGLLGRRDVCSIVSGRPQQLNLRGRGRLLRGLSWDAANP